MKQRETPKPGHRLDTISAVTEYFEETVHHMDSGHKHEAEAIATIQTVISMIRMHSLKTIEAVKEHLQQPGMPPKAQEIMGKFPSWLRHKGHDYIPKH